VRPNAVDYRVHIKIWLSGVLIHDHLYLDFPDTSMPCFTVGRGLAINLGDCSGTATVTADKVWLPAGSHNYITCSSTFGSFEYPGDPNICPDQ